MDDKDVIVLGYGPDPAPGFEDELILVGASSSYDHVEELAEDYPEVIFFYTKLEAI